jgi:hypothetical protein
MIPLPLRDGEHVGRDAIPIMRPEKVEQITPDALQIRAAEQRRDAVVSVGVGPTLKEIQGPLQAEFLIEEPLLESKFGLANRLLPSALGGPLKVTSLASLTDHALDHPEEHIGPVVEMEVRGSECQRPGQLRQLRGMLIEKSHWEALVIVVPQMGKQLLALLCTGLAPKVEKQRLRCRSFSGRSGHAHVRRTVIIPIVSEQKTVLLQPLLVEPIDQLGRDWVMRQRPPRLLSAEPEHLRAVSGGHLHEKLTGDPLRFLRPKENEQVAEITVMRAVPEGPVVQELLQLFDREGCPQARQCLHDVLSFPLTLTSVQEQASKGRNGRRLGEAREQCDRIRACVFRLHLLRVVPAWRGRRLQQELGELRAHLGARRPGQLFRSQHRHAPWA